MPAGAEAPLPSIPPLLEAVLAVGTDLELHATLQHIVDSAARLTGAGYGTLTVGAAGAGGSAELFVTGDRASAGPATAQDVIDMPIHVHDEAFGDLLLARKERGAFTDDDRQLLKVLAGQAGIAIGNARLFEAARQRERWIEGAAAVTTALLTGEAAADALMTVADRARILAGAAAGVILQPTEAGGMTIVAAATDGAPHGWGTKSWRGAHTGSAHGPDRLADTGGSPNAEPASAEAAAPDTETGQATRTDAPHGTDRRPNPTGPQGTEPTTAETAAPDTETARDTHTDTPHATDRQPNTTRSQNTEPISAETAARDTETEQEARADTPHATDRRPSPTGPQDTEPTSAQATAPDTETGQDTHTRAPHGTDRQPNTTRSQSTAPTNAQATTPDTETEHDTHTNTPHATDQRPNPAGPDAVTRQDARAGALPGTDRRSNTARAQDTAPGPGSRQAAHTEDSPATAGEPDHARPGPSPNDLIGTTIEPGSAVLEQLLGGEPVFIEDSATDPRMTTHVRARFGPSMMLPLQAGGRLIGTLALPRRRGAPAYTAAERLLATQFASQAALALVLADAQQSRQRLAVFEDRDRIARDLHDLVVQRLFATGMMLESTRRRAASAKVESTLDHAVDELESTIQEVRTAIFALQQPPADAPTTFRGKVLRETAGAAAVLGIQPSTQFAGAVDAQVTEPVASHLLAALRRALATTSRRTGVSRVDVTVDARATLPDGRTGVRLTVHDDGATDGVEAGTTVTWQAPL
ncbi:sensor histidine kinase [Streptomyces kanamyceticus]|uniref:sensor histidine kinase n=1 Tax=Streptomyces kanamyceticus TaxID=1967 RepID=UPI001CC44F53|nr:GAF domain-containing sensor histidine kinase [Streptomyces kanamyceticus]